MDIGHCLCVLLFLVHIVPEQWHFFFLCLFCYHAQGMHRGSYLHNVITPWENGWVWSHLRTVIAPKEKCKGVITPIAEGEGCDHSPMVWSQHDASVRLAIGWSALLSTLSRGSRKKRRGGPRIIRTTADTSGHPSYNWSVSISYNSLSFFFWLCFAYQFRYQLKMNWNERCWTPRKAQQKETTETVNEARNDFEIEWFTRGSFNVPRNFLLRVLRVGHKEVDLIFCALCNWRILVRVCVLVISALNFLTMMFDSDRKELKLKITDQLSTYQYHHGIFCDQHMKHVHHNETVIEHFQQFLTTQTRAIVLLTRNINSWS